MVFAIIYYQFGIRNGEDSEMRSRMNDLSNKHYHWCVDKTWDLASEVSLASIQALVLMATHCRCFPKPGPAWLMTTLAWNRAIEMNLHRSSSSSQRADEPANLVESEMRKRAWWCLFMIVVVMYGRLGKPMPIRGEDVDVEYPVAVADEYLTEGGLIEAAPPAADCPWAVASAGFRLAVLFMDMYNKVHVVRSDARGHVEAVRLLEDKLRAYQRDLPDDLQLDKCRPGSRIMATYLEASHCEFLLCLRHPSRCATNDPAFVAESYRVCEDAARRLLRLASELARLKSLDTTWYQLAVYVAAVFTLLAARWVRRAEVTPVELAALKDEMKTGLSVIQEVFKYIGMFISMYALAQIHSRTDICHFLGATDSRVMHQIQSVVDRTIGSIEQDMAAQQQQQQSSSSNTSTSYYQPQQMHNRPVKHEDYSQGPAAGRQVRPQRSATGTPTPGSAKDQMSSLQQHRGGGGTASYYNSPITQINTAYSQMGYPELASSGVAPGPPAPPPSTTTNASTLSGSYLPTTEDPQQQQQQHHQYLYAASAAASAAAQLGHSTPASSPQPATAPNPAALVGYGAPPPQGPTPPQQQQHHNHHSSHAHQHHAHPQQQHPHSHHPHAHHPHHQQQHAHHHHHHQAAAAATGGPATSWLAAVPSSGNPWNEWPGAAMVDPASQDRYSANALLTLGAAPGQRGPGDASGGGAGGGGPGAGGGAGPEMGVGGHPSMPAGQHAGGQQWPMLLFHPSVSGP